MSVLQKARILPLDDSQRMKRRMIAVLILVCAMVIVGCSPSQESRFGEFKLEGERLVEQMIELIPAELEPVQDAEMDSSGVTPQNGWSTKKRARDSAHWKVFAYLQLASQEDARSCSPVRGSRQI